MHSEQGLCLCNNLLQVHLQEILANKLKTFSTLYCNQRCIMHLHLPVVVLEVTLLRLLMLFTGQKRVFFFMKMQVSTTLFFSKSRHRT